MSFALANQNFMDGCVGAWSFTNQKFPSSQVIDFSGKNNHGTATNVDISTDWIVSNGGYAFVGDGSSKYIALSSVPPNVSGAIIFGLSAWVNCDGKSNSGSSRVIASRSDATSTRNLALTYRSDTQQLTISARSTFGGGSNVSASETVVLDGLGWQHVLGTANGNEITLYRNGNLVSSSTSSMSGSFSTTPTVAYIAGDPNVAASYFNGRVDDVLWYARACNAFDAKQLSLRRGIAFEQTRIRRYKTASAAPATNSSNLLLLGVG